MSSDAQMRAAIGRLTENEKACLRRWLQHQTAKEMARDLGISTHAVEKRLKMARAKLGLASSLEAARQLERFEGYGQLALKSPVLSTDAAIDEDTPVEVPGAPGGRAGRRGAPFALAMLTLVAVLAGWWLIASRRDVAPRAIATPAASNEAPSAPAAAELAAQFQKLVGDPRNLKIDTTSRRKPSSAEVGTYLAESFTIIDKNHSGYLERDEAPEPFNTAGRLVRGRLGQALWIARGDSDRDGRISLTEYRAWHGPSVQRLGVPTLWRPGHVTPRYSIRVKSPGIEWRKGTLEEIREIVAKSFEHMDRNLSGFIEREEAPAKMGVSDPRPVDAPADRNAMHWFEGAEAQTMWIARSDTDGDGKVSAAEFAAVMRPMLEHVGVPANMPPRPDPARL